MSNVLLVTLLIFLARMTDVSMGTLRQIMIIHGQRKIGSVIGFFEIMIWAMAVSQVISQLSTSNIHYLLAFAGGFATGNFLGSFIEEKIALGYIFAYIVPKRSSDLDNKLREAGFGVTIIHGRGSKGTRHILNVLFRRRDEQKLLGIIKKYDRGAFYTITDIRSHRGGFIIGAAKKK